jgi:hypothetical protein
MNFRLTNHVKEEKARRAITLPLLEQVLTAPQQIVTEKENLKAYQSIVSCEEKKSFLLRVIVDDSITPMVVITVYRTSKIGKYWRSE